MGLYEENSLRIKITWIKGKNITEERFIYVHILNVNISNSRPRGKNRLI